MHPLIAEEISFNEMPSELMRRFINYPYHFILESSHKEHPLSQWSFIGFSPSIVFENSGSIIRILDKEIQTTYDKNPFDFFTRFFYQINSENRKCHLPAGIPFRGGWIGYLGYEMRCFLDNLPGENPPLIKLPDTCFMYYKKYIAYNHIDNKYFLIAPENEMNDFRKTILSHKKQNNKIKYQVETLNPYIDKKSYLNTIEKAQNFINKGDAYQINLSYPFSGTLNGDITCTYEIYCRLTKKSPAPFSAYIGLNDIRIVSSSPERFIKIQNGMIESRPMKGTRPRGETPEKDQQLKRDLEESEKDRAENVMIVDLMRNDISRVAEVGTVKVPELFTIENYKTVFHMTSSVTGCLVHNKNIFDAIKATFPPGSMTGAPKIRAMELIDKLEKVQRGIYSGILGYINNDESCEFSVVIRTLVVKQKFFTFHVGGAILSYSNPEMEYFETLNKAEGVMQALRVKKFST